MYSESSRINQSSTLDILKRSKLLEHFDGFVKEYEFNASARLLFPYISTAQGLEQWFADKAITRGNGAINFEWDQTQHLATVGSQKLNRLVRFDFAAPGQGVVLASTDDLVNEVVTPFIEFSIETSPVSESVFLKITDSTTSGTGDVEETWDNLVSNLKDIVRG